MRLSRALIVLLSEHYAAARGIEDALGRMLAPPAGPPGGGEALGEQVGRAMSRLRGERRTVPDAQEVERWLRDVLGVEGLSAAREDAATLRNMLEIVCEAYFDAAKVVFAAIWQLTASARPGIHRMSEEEKEDAASEVMLHLLTCAHAETRTLRTIQHEDQGIADAAANEFLRMSLRRRLLSIQEKRERTKGDEGSREEGREEKEPVANEVGEAEPSTEDYVERLVRAVHEVAATKNGRARETFEKSWTEIIALNRGECSMDDLIRTEVDAPPGGRGSAGGSGADRTRARDSMYQRHQRARGVVLAHLEEGIPRDRLLIEFVRSFRRREA